MTEPDTKEYSEEKMRAIQKAFDVHLNPPYGLCVDKPREYKYEV